MPRRRSNPGHVLAAVLLALAGCNQAPTDETGAEKSPQQTVGLMTSLPLYWPEGAELHELAAGNTAPPWQRQAIEGRYAIVPLDTLSPIPALPPDAAEVDPLAGLARLAVIQPRGLSPADNVALDAWVRRGGRLLLVLDPALTGDYDAPLGDPRRPVDGALIPPVVARWGLAISFDEGHELAVTTTTLAGAQLPLALAGRIAITDPRAADCTRLAAGAAASCRVGKGQVMVIADAALFEHPELAGEGGVRLREVLAAALD
ncbi:MAG: GldG family protein [Alphaproteobacteria bacterium]|nr:GldG family protein [Alphaproteobacteria bacterium]